MSTNAVPVTLQTNLRALRPDDFRLQDVLHCQAIVQKETDIPQSEYQAVSQATLKYLGQPARIISTIDKSSFFANPEHRTTLERDERNHQFVLVVSYNGHDKPPASFTEFDCASVCLASNVDPDIVFETAHSAFKRTQLPDNKWRWCRTQIITSNVSEAELEVALEKILQALDPEDKGLASAWCHRVVMECQVLELSRLLPSIVEGKDFVDSNAGIKIPFARLNELARIIKSSTLPRTIPQDAHNADGLTLLPCISPTVYLDEMSQLLVAEKMHVHVTPDTKTHTLADLLIKQFSGTLSTEDRSAKLKTLGRMLKGLRVNVRVAGEVEERVISAMWDGNSQSAPARLRHHVWTSKRGDCPFEDLPCANVGSSWDPVLLPPEYCHVVPGQDLRGTHTPSLSRSIESLRRSALSTSTPTESMSGHLILRPQSKKIDNLQVVSDRFNGVLPTVLFLEAGTTGVKSSCWDSARQTLNEAMQRVSQSSALASTDKACPILSLKYEASPDIKALWTQQIRQFVSTNVPSDQRTLLVVCLQSENTHAAMYDIIKNACDIEAGLQTIFVNSATLEAKSHNKPSQAAAMVVGTICRKFRLRNPPMLPKSGRQAATNLVVGMHVMPFTPQTPFVLDDGTLQRGNSEMVLVSLVSRALEYSADYHTEVKLSSKAKYEKLDKADLIRPFLKGVTSSERNLTVLRSGYLVDGLQEDGKRLCEESREIATACDAAGSSFTYATLSEDKLLKIRVNDRNRSSQDSNHRALLVAQSNVRGNTNQSYFWVFHDQEAADGTTGIKVTFHQRTRTDSSLGNTTLALRSGGSLTPQKSSRDSRKASGIVKPSPSPLQEHGSPSPAPRAIKSPSLPQRQASQPLAGIPPNIANGSPRTPTANPSVSRTLPEIAILDHIWKDDHLELYDTKWPIPTYLARLALKRAQTHLVTNDWGNKKHGQTPPVYLPEVPMEVRRTLYYI